MNPKSTIMRSEAADAASTLLRAAEDMERLNPVPYTAITNIRTVAEGLKSESLVIIPDWRLTHASYVC